MQIRKLAIAAFAAMALSMFSLSAQGATIVTNGSFEITQGRVGNTTTPLTCPPVCGSLQSSANITGVGVADVTIPGWSVSDDGIGCVVLEATNPGSCGGSGSSRFGSTSLSKDPGFSPDGGNYVFFDAQPSGANTSALEQFVNLTKGQSYQLIFYQAAAQFVFGVANKNNTTEQWQVGVGSDLSVSTPVMTTVFQGNTPWQAESYTFTASGGSELLSFLAVGGPAGDPPTVLLDGVSITATPEPATAVLLGIGLLGGLAVRRYRKERG